MKRTHILASLLILLFHLFIFRGVSYGTVTVTISGPTNTDHTNGTADFDGTITVTSETIISKGVCWGLTHDPTIDANNHTANGSGTTSFTATITGLMAGQTYYVRAYATDSDGNTNYSGEVSVTINSTRPRVTTLPVTGISSTRATCGGNVDSEGGEPVTARGICWSTSSYPTLSDNYTVNGTGRGSFSVEITGLTPETGYYVRAYATNALGTRYGDNVNFTTLSTPALPVVETDSVSGITPTGAVCGGYVKDEGEEPVTARGVCWGTSSPPNIVDDLYTDNGTGGGRFTSTITGLTTGVTYYIRAYAVNANGTGYGEERTFIPGDYAPQISAIPQQLYFKRIISGAVTPEQQFLITNTGHKDSTLTWSIHYSAPWFEATPTSGSPDGLVTVSIDPTGLEIGENTGFITITDPEASNSPLAVTVTLVIAGAGSDQVPEGSFETPADGALVSGSVPLTGWAVDDVAVKHVKIYRDPVPGNNEGTDMVYIGDAVFVEGARPDVEDTYPGYPNNSRAGWGYLLLTHSLPNGGNGSYVLHAVVEDLAGNQVSLGSKTITCDNANAVKPFGTIDTPAPGETASGSQFISWGWALTPNPNHIPADGSTIHVMVDGKDLGNPYYSHPRPDIAALFPGYVNSDAAGGYFYLDTTQCSSGLHTISWFVIDSAGNADGIGSRYFTILNAGTSRSSVYSCAAYRGTETPVSGSIAVCTGWRLDYENQRILTPGKNNIFSIDTRELEPVEVLPPTGTVYRAAGLMVKGKHRPLPPGAGLNSQTGGFRWMPGPGFVGAYSFMLTGKRTDGQTIRDHIVITIKPKFNYKL